MAEAYRDARGQDGAKQQERPGAPPHGHTLQPSTGQHSRGCYCAGVEKQSPGVKPSAVHVSVRKWRITLALKRRFANCSKCSNCSRGAEVRGGPGNAPIASKSAAVVPRWYPEIKKDLAVSS